MPVDQSPNQKSSYCQFKKEHCRKRLKPVRFKFKHIQWTSMGIDSSSNQCDVSIRYKQVSLYFLS